MTQPNTPATAIPATAAVPDVGQSRRTGFAYLLVAVFSYGGLWPVMRVGVDYLPPFWFAVARLALGSLFLFALLAALRRLRMPRRADWPAIFSVGVCMMGLYVSLAHYAMQFVPAGRGALLAYSTPLWVTPFAVLFQGERMTRTKIAGLVLGVSGLALLFNPAAFDWSDRDVLLGNGLLLLAAFSWSFALLHLRVHRWNLSPLQLGPWQLVVAVIVALPFALLLETRSDIRWGTDLYLLVAYGGVFGTAIAMFTAASAVRIVGPFTASIALLGCPVVAISLSVLLLGEPATVTLLGGLIMIVSGIALVSLPQSR